MCTQKPPHDYSEQLYVLYKEAFSKYIHDKVRLLLPGYQYGWLTDAV
jgi:hypothetical protein